MSDPQRNLVETEAEQIRRFLHHRKRQENAENLRVGQWVVLNPHTSYGHLGQIVRVLEIDSEPACVVLFAGNDFQLCRATDLSEPISFDSHLPASYEDQVSEG